MKLMSALAMATTLVLSFGPADVQARTFKWQDDSGLTHFTQVPPPETCQTLSCRKARGTAVKLSKPVEIAASKARYRTSAIMAPANATPAKGRKAPPLTAPPARRAVPAAPGDANPATAQPVATSASSG